MSVTYIALGSYSKTQTVFDLLGDCNVNLLFLSWYSESVIMSDINCKNGWMMLTYCFIIIEQSGIRLYMDGITVQQLS